MLRAIDYFSLGATLYLPMNHKNVLPILKRKKYPELRSVVLCLEDSISKKDVPSAMSFLEKMLKEELFKQTELKVFIRPRDIENLKKMINMKNIEKLIDGFAIPKFDTENASQYLSIFIKHNNFHIMPIIETKDALSSVRLSRIATELEPFKDRVLSVRIGGEDILSLLHMMREESKTLYEIMPLYLVFSTIINLFKSNGFNVSSPVYACFGRDDIFSHELQGDVEHQVFNKTIIHPDQIDIIHHAYQPTKDEVKIAQKLLHGDEAVFGINGRMYEKATHSNWAKNIQKRAFFYGVKGEKKNRFLEEGKIYKAIVKINKEEVLSEDNAGWIEEIFYFRPVQMGIRTSKQGNMPIFKKIKSDNKVRNSNGEVDRKKNKVDYLLETTLIVPHFDIYNTPMPNNKQKTKEITYNIMDKLIWEALNSFMEVTDKSELAMAEKMINDAEKYKKEQAEAIERSMDMTL